MQGRKILAGALAASLLLSGIALPEVSVGASDDNETYVVQGYVYYTDDTIELDENYSNMNMTTLIGYTVADTDISSFSYSLQCADDVSFNEWANIHFVVTVDGVATDYEVPGLTDENEWTYGYLLEDQTLELETDILAGSTYKVEAYTQRWGGAEDYVYSVEMLSYEPLCIACGECGDDLIWVLHDDGTLIINGTGDMYDYSSVMSVPWYDYRESVTNIVISDGVTNIAYGAFWGCSNAVSVDIADTVTSIGDYAFRYCSSLTSVEIPSGVVTIGRNAFADCTSLKDITIPNTVTTIGEYAFSNCTSLEGIDIPNSVTTLEQGVFSSCTSLKSIYIPASVTDMGAAVARSCTSLESVKVDEDNESYVSIDDVIYTKDMTTLMYCMTTKEGSIVVPDTVTTIEAYAFIECSGITSIEMPETVSEIGTLTFFNCTGLTEINLPDALTTLSYGLLYGCSGITSLVVPEGVTSIEFDAVGSCTSLTTLWMSTGVTKIETSAFYDCNSLTDIYYSGTEDEWEEMNISWDSIGYFSNATIHYECILGDINRDGEVNYLDAMTALRYDAELVTLTDEQLAIGDVNNDGEVNSLDAILILRYDAGLITSF